jgi:hypothetical protein
MNIDNSLRGLTIRELRRIRTWPLFPWEPVPFSVLFEGKPYRDPYIQSVSNFFKGGRSSLQGVVLRFSF